MKKVIFLSLALFLSCGISFSLETQMPSDEEILETIRQFNFDKQKEEYLFKETKKSLIKMYENGEIESVIKDAQQGCEFEPDVKKTDKNIEASEPSVENPNKNRQK